LIIIPLLGQGTRKMQLVELDFQLASTPSMAKCPQGTINKMLPEVAQNNKREEQRRKREGKRKGSLVWSSLVY
jgi:hypothetical protein